MARTSKKSTIENNIQETNPKPKRKYTRRTKVDDTSVKPIVSETIHTEEETPKTKRKYTKRAKVEETSVKTDISETTDSKVVEKPKRKYTKRTKTEETPADNIVSENIPNKEETPKTKKAKKDDIPFDIANITLKDIRQYPIKNGEIRRAIEVYYDMQDMRIQSGNRKRAVIRTEKEQLIEEAKENNLPIDDIEVSKPIYLQYIENRFKETEVTIAKFLEQYAMNHPVGKWMLSITGIGPVFAAGLLAYIDINKCETAGAIWKYAGWDIGGKVRAAGKRVDWNPAFRTLCWKIGESFCKSSNRDSCYYGHLYKEKKDWYTAKNEAGGFAEKAAEELKRKKYRKDTEAYKCYSNGKLPPAHINAMAKRFAVKMFLSHLFEVWYEYERGVKPPRPFVEEHLGHVHILPPPNREILFPTEK